MFLNLILSALAKDVNVGMAPDTCKPFSESLRLISGARETEEVDSLYQKAKGCLSNSSTYLTQYELAQLFIAGTSQDPNHSRKRLTEMFQRYPEAGMNDTRLQSLERKLSLGAEEVKLLVENARADALKESAERVEIRAGDFIMVDGVPLHPGDRHTFPEGEFLIQWRDATNEIRGRQEKLEGSTRWVVNSAQSIALRSDQEFEPSIGWNATSTQSQPLRAGKKHKAGLALGISGGVLTLASATTLIVGTHMLHDRALDYNVDDDLGQQLNWIQGAGIGGTLAGTALMLVPAFSGTFK